MTKTGTTTGHRARGPQRIISRWGAPPKRILSRLGSRLDRRINLGSQTRDLAFGDPLSVLLQLMVLASMILASWVNLQRQLDLLQHDVLGSQTRRVAFGGAPSREIMRLGTRVPSMLLQSQKEFQQKLETLSERSLSHEYRLQLVEKDRNG